MHTCDSMDYRRDWVIETGDAGPHVQNNTDSITRHLRSGPGISEQISGRREGVKQQSIPFLERLGK